MDAPAVLGILAALGAAWYCWSVFSVPGVGGFAIDARRAPPAVSHGPATPKDSALAEAEAAAAEAQGASEDYLKQVRGSQDGGWSYSQTLDKVRGGAVHFATTTSTNRIEQSFPYEAQTAMSLRLQHSANLGDTVIIQISSGQLMCPSYRGCAATVSFDDGPPQSVQFDGTSDNSSTKIVVSEPKSFISNLKKSKRVVVEKALYQAGTPQFEFNVGGLLWEH